MKNSPYLDRPARSEAAIKAIQAAKEIQQRLDRLEAIEPIYQDLLKACIWAEAALAPFSKEPAEKSGIAMLRAVIAKAKAKATGKDT